MPPVTRSRAASDKLNGFTKRKLLNYLKRTKNTEATLTRIIEINKKLRPIKHLNRLKERKKAHLKRQNALTKFHESVWMMTNDLHEIFGDDARMKEKRTLAKEKKVTEQVLKRLDSAGEEEDPNPWKSCGECGVEYTVTGVNTPRVLKCGHTICLQCCKLTVVDDSYVRCPVDDEYTFVGNDSLEEVLPKNYSVLDM